MGLLLVVVEALWFGGGALGHTLRRQNKSPSCDCLNILCLIVFIRLWCSPRESLSFSQGRFPLSPSCSHTLLNNLRSFPCMVNPNHLGYTPPWRLRQRELSAAAAAAAAMWPRSLSRSPKFPPMTRRCRLLSCTCLCQTAAWRRMVCCCVPPRIQMSAGGCSPAQITDKLILACLSAWPYYRGTNECSQ